MTTHRKLTIAVLYGGRSGEHEVSLVSAASVIRNLDRSRFQVVPVAVDKQGRWLLEDARLIEQAASTPGRPLPLLQGALEVVLPPRAEGGASSLVLLGPQAGERPAIDVVFPVMHGTLGEDGTLQGLLELADVPYVGCGVLASAVAMDKDVAKRLAMGAGLPVVPYVGVRAAEWERDPAGLLERLVGLIEADDAGLGWPCFVKPANSGSSVGVHKARDRAELSAALADAFRFDRKVLVERAIAAREIEVSVLEHAEPGQPPRVSVPGEIVPRHEFYSYEAKYLDEHGAALEIPARLSGPQASEVQRLARAAFTALECEGMARADFFLDKASGQLYLNELNTIPGFTAISMYPKLWEASGLPYAELLSALIDLALARHQRKQRLVRDFR